MTAATAETIAAIPLSSSLKDLEKGMAQAGSYADWSELALQHDMQSGGTRWRETLETTLYDYTEIRSRHEKLRQWLAQRASSELLYALNEGVHGNMGGMGRPILYSRALSGTKQMIEDYVGAIAQALNFIHRCPEQEISQTEKVDFFHRASHCYGRSALLLSGGAGLIYFHHGVVQELIDHDLLPNVISGASAGAIMAAQLGTLSNEELKQGYFTKKRYHAPTQTRMLDVIMGKVEPVDLKEAREQLLDEIIPRDITFQEAFEKTGRYINISISPAGKHQSSRLMNAITSPNVYIRAAVSASIAIPGLLAPERLYGVNHFIVSLINPVVVPFIRDVKTQQYKGLRNALSVSTVRVAGELLTVVERLLAGRGTRGKALAAQLAYLTAMLDQSYLGDINIMLSKSDFKWRQALFEFRPGEVESMIQAGMRSTWPKISMIRNAALISQTLDRVLEELSMDAMGCNTRAKHHVYA